MAEPLVKDIKEALLDDLKTTIRKMVHEVVQEEFETLHKRFNALERTMDSWKSDLDEDRRNLRSVSSSANQINHELKEVGESIDKLPKKLENTIEDTVKDTVKESTREAIPKAVTDAFDVVGESVTVTEKKRHFWQFWG